ncbi:hypothetical protein H0A61_02952 [Koleobacter methoxysyntrophicus]|uniref:Uncharacterized protein n=1 Tax=Koleobacter methoxysyntrophicus TaxID=2751313 RepID=A0A8A0RRL5_9FIRM|nr:hypothetical protein [Koleobacter methoxysyntrophicus]QSQ10542.1 hypothetical protein H0A61_02952 [Koleobacter methoxysyntrophicus]
MPKKRAEIQSGEMTEEEIEHQIWQVGKGFAIQNYHHDSLCGEEWYYIIPVAESRYRKYAV